MWDVIVEVPPNKPLERTGCAGRSAPIRWTGRA
jgi:hypothetical protein